MKIAQAGLKVLRDGNAAGLCLNFEKGLTVFGFFLYRRAGTAAAGTGFFGTKRIAHHAGNVPNGKPEDDGNEYILNDGVKHVAKLKK